MDVHLHTKINDVVEAFRVALHQQAPCWSTIRTSAAVFDFEQGLQAVLNRLQTEIVGAVLEAIHRDRDFVTACQNQSRLQRGVYSDGWHDVRVHTLGGHFVHLKTPYAKLPKERRQERREKRPRQQGTGLYPVLRRLGIVRRTTPRLLAEVNRHLADGPSGAEAAERLASREIMLTAIPMRLLVRDFASIALWQRQAAATQLEHVTVFEPAPLSGKRVVVGLDRGRLRLRIDKRVSEQTRTKRYTPEQCEPKLFAIYTVDHQGKKERHGDVLYDGTLQSASHLFTLLKLRLKQLGITQASMLIIIGDGASIRYFQTHQARMQYEQFRSEGFPLGSGSIESGVRRIVNLRLKGASLFWHPENAEALLYLRCQIKSGRWATFVKSVLTQWATDMAPSLTLAYHVRKAIAAAVRVSHPPKSALDTRQDVITWARQVVESGEPLILDTETTDLDTTDEVVQLAVVDMHGHVLLNPLVRPTRPIAPEARAIHGITDQALADAPPFSVLYHAIAHLLSHRLVLAYNAAFDRRLLTQTCTIYGLPPLEIAAWDCVMERYACFWGEWANPGSYKPQSLSTPCTQQGINVHGHHEAVQDCLLTLALIKAMAVAGEEET